MIDYEKIIDSLTEEGVKKLLESLDIEYLDRGSHLIMPTYCHHSKDEEASWKLYYYKDTHLFVCYTEDGTMSIFNFLKHFYDAQGIIYDWYNDVYLAVLNCTANLNLNGFETYKSILSKYIPISRKPLPAYNEAVLDRFPITLHKDWYDDHISLAAVQKYRIGFDLTTNHIVIPHFDVNNRLVGIRGRALNPEDIENFGKYMPLQVEDTWYTHPLSLNLYGLNFNKENIKKSGYCCIVESEKSVLQAESFSGSNCCVATCGSNFNKYALKLLLREAAPKEIIICYDKENEPYDRSYFEKLYHMCEKYIEYCNFSFVYDRWNLLSLKDSPTDKGEEVFRKLLKKRVPVY